MPDWASGRLPAGSGSVHIAPGPDGDLYLLADSPQALTTGPASRATFARLDREGTVRPGWPTVLEGWFCAVEYGSTRPVGPLVAPDGSMRALCTSDDRPTGGAGDDGPVRVAVGLTADGSQLDGWPVDMRGMGWETPAVLAGSSLVVAASVTREDPPSGGMLSNLWVSHTGADGLRRESPRLQATGVPWTVLGADGVSRVVNLDAGGQVLAMTLQGVVEGWPATIGPGMSGPAAGPDRTTVIAVVAGNTTRTVVLDAWGRQTGTGSEVRMLVQSPEWSGAGSAGSPAIPLVAADGTVYLLEQDEDSILVDAIDATGRAVPGYPVRVPGRLEERGRCSGQESGCGVWSVRPAVGPDGTVYLALQAQAAGEAGSLVALDRSGRIATGWPVAAGSAGHAFREVQVGHDGTVFAVVVDRPDQPAAWSVLALEPDGSTRYRLPVVESDR